MMERIRSWNRTFFLVRSQKYDFDVNRMVPGTEVRQILERGVFHTFTERFQRTPKLLNPTNFVTSGQTKVQKCMHV